MNLRMWLAACALIMALGCGTKSDPASKAAASSGDEATCQDSCPMKVEGTTLSYEETPDGAAMVFTTTGDVAELQRRVADRATHHDEMAANHHGPHAPPAHSARADTTERGARLIMTPSDASQLEALRSHVKEHVEAAQGGHCPMMDDHHGPGGHHHDGEHGPHHEHGPHGPDGTPPAAPATPSAG